MMEINKAIKRLLRQDGIGAGVGEGHEPSQRLAELQSVEELNEADQPTKGRDGRDGLGGGSTKELAGGENGVQCPLHRLVHGRRALVCSHSQVTTPSVPNDAF